MGEHKGLLVDFGGVLTTSVTESFEAFCRDEGIEFEVFKTVVLGAARTPDSPFTLVERGDIEQDEFDRRIAAVLSEACGRAVDPAGLKQRLFARAVPDERMIAAVGRAREHGVRTALVSNSWGGRDYPEDVLGRLFDEVLISGLIGLRKPDPEIYLLAARTLGVDPPDCIFVDDFPVNVEGARAVGMAAVRHRSAEETIPALERFLGVSLAGPASRAAGRGG